MNGSREAQHSPFWTYSLRLYAQPGVPAACLALQDACGVDVNVLLFCLYAAASGRQVGREDVLRMIDLVADWKDSMVVPIRGARRFLKQPPEAFAGIAADALRSRVKAIELEAERLQQEALFASFGMDALGAPAPRAERANIAAYAAALGADFDSSAVSALFSACANLKDHTE